MASLDKQPNDNLNYLKLAIKIGLFCFILSVFLLGTLKVLAKKGQATEDASYVEQAESDVITREAKTIEDFEKSGLLNDIFKKPGQKQVEAKNESLKAPAISENQNNVQAIIPEATPTTIKEATIPKTSNDLVEVSENANQNASNKIFEFDPKENYQAKITSYIAKQKIANLNPEDLATTIITESQTVKLNPLITTFLIERESQFNRYSENSNGRVGLLQIHPNEAKVITKKIDLPFLGTVSLYHPIYNIRLGLQLLVEQKNTSESWEEAIKKFSKLGNTKEANQYLEKTITQATLMNNGRQN